MNFVPRKLFRTFCPIMQCFLTGENDTEDQKDSDSLTPMTWFLPTLFIYLFISHMTNTIGLFFFYLLSLKPVTKTLEGISMAYKRLIIKKCFLIHYVLQYRFSVEAMISELCQILRNKHTCTHKHTLLSVTHIRLSGYLHKTVEPGRCGHQVRRGPEAQSAEGLTDLHRRLKALASTDL